MPRLLTVFGVLCLAISGTAQSRRQSVLIILPDPPGRPVSNLIFEGMQNQLRAADPGIAITTDYIGQFGKDRAGFQAAQKEWYRTKYSGIRFDVIVVLGPQALDAVLLIRDELWPGVPVVFAGVEEEIVKRYPANSNLTGVVLDSAIEANVRLLRRMFPEMKRLAVAGGSSPQDRAYNARLLQYLRTLAPDLGILELTNLPVDELENRVRNLPPNTVLILDSYLYDPAGRPMFIRDLAAALSRVANAPLFMTPEFGMGVGAIGGMMMHLGTVGAETAKLALRVLGGAAPATIPLLHITGSRLEFDWRQLQKWKVPPERIPPGAEILFRQISTWERFRWWLLGIFVAGVLESALIAILLLERRKARISEGERKRAEADSLNSRAQLSHLNRIASMGELAASLAHELNQPLAAILSNAQAASQFLKQRPPNLDEVGAALEDIRDDDIRAGEVIRKMRHMLRRGPPQSVPVDLNAVASEAVELMRSDAQMRRIVVELDLSPDRPTARGDAVTLQQVVMNLVLNAMESMPPEANAGALQERRIVVRSEAGTPTDGPRITVTDSGPGLSTEIKDRIFDPFFSTKQDGLGMGLSISRSIVEAHGGRVWAENREEGGAAFYVMLRPAAAATVAVAG